MSDMPIKVGDLPCTSGLLIIADADLPDTRWKTKDHAAGDWLCDISGARAEYFAKRHGTGFRVEELCDGTWRVRCPGALMAQRVATEITRFCTAEGIGDHVAIAYPLNWHRTRGVDAARRTGIGFDAVDRFIAANVSKGGSLPVVAHFDDEGKVERIVIHLT